MEGPTTVLVLVAVLSTLARPAEPLDAAILGIECGSLLCGREYSNGHGRGVNPAASLCWGDALEAMTAGFLAPLT